MGTSVGQIYGRTLTIIKERFGSLLGLWATFFAINIGLILVFGLVVGFGALAGAATSADTGALGLGVMLFGILFYVAYILVYCAQSASMTAMASPLQRLTFGEAMNAGFRSALPMLLLFIILLVAYFLAAIVVGLLIGILAFAGKAGSLVGMVLVFIGVMYLACRLCTVNAVIAVERVRNPLTALSRGWAMTRDNALTIFLALLGFAVIAILVIVAALAPAASLFSAAFNPLGPQPEAPGMGTIIYLIVAGILVSITMVIASATLMSVIHGELAGPGMHNTDDVFA
ncbi:MAG: hypothetical protein ACKOPQ_00495 [Novosphingobium sp.]